MFKQSSRDESRLHGVLRQLGSNSSLGTPLFCPERFIGFFFWKFLACGREYSLNREWHLNGELHPFPRISLWALNPCKIGTKHARKNTASKNTGRPLNGSTRRSSSKIAGLPRETLPVSSRPNSPALPFTKGKKLLPAGIFAESFSKIWSKERSPPTLEALPIVVPSLVIFFWRRLARKRLPTSCPRKDFESVFPKAENCLWSFKSYWG